MFKEKGPRGEYTVTVVQRKRTGLQGHYREKLVQKTEQACRANTELSLFKGQNRPAGQILS